MINKILYVLEKKDRIRLVLLIMLMLVGACVELISVSVILPLVNVVTDKDIIYTDTTYQFIGNIFHLTNVSDYVIFFAIAIAIMYVFKNVFLVIENDIQFRFLFNSKRKLSSRLLASYLSKDYLFFTQNSIPELQRNIVQDVGTFYYALQSMLQLVTEIIVGVVLVVYLFTVDIITTACIFCLLGLFSVAFFVIYRKQCTKRGRIFRDATAITNKWLLQSFEGIKEIKIMHKEEFFWENYDNASKVVAHSDRVSHVLSYIPRPVMETFVIAGLMLVIGVRVFLGGSIDGFVSVLSAFVVAAYRMIPAFNRIAANYSWIMYGKPSVDSVYDIVKKFEIENADKLVEEGEIRFNDINVDNLTFKYPEGKENVIENVAFIIPLNKSVAFVGKSGAGKTTLADLILGIINPTSGDVKVSGKSIYDNKTAWQKQIGYIPQVIYLMDDTIRNNIAFGIDGSDIDDDAIWNALKEAQLDEYVKGLPKQLDTMVGDRGIRLSGGQRQRIGIARALYRNPLFLVFDEATSALDGETEQAVMESIKALHGKRTILIIAHRLSTIKDCDIIFKVEDKKVTQVAYTDLDS